MARDTGIVLAEFLAEGIAIIGYAGSFGDEQPRYRVVVDSEALKALSPLELDKLAHTVGMYVLGFCPIH